MLCGDIEVTNYSGQVIAELSEQSMFPDNDTFVMIPITELKTNLLQNSEHFDKAIAPFTNSTAVKNGSTTFDGETYWYCNFNQSRYIQVDFPTLELGKDYYFSFEALRTPEGTSQIIQHEIFIGADTYYGGSLKNGVWTKTTVKFTADATSTEAKIYCGYQAQTTNWSAYFRHFYLGEWDTEWFSGNDVPFYSNAILKLNSSGELNVLGNYPKAVLHTNGTVIHLNDKYYNAAIGNIYNDGSSPL